MANQCYLRDLVSFRAHSWLSADSLRMQSAKGARVRV